VNFIDVEGIHVAAALDPEVKSKRIYAIAKHVTWNTHLVIMRKMFQENNFLDDLKELGILSGTVEDEDLGLKLLKKWGPLDDWFRWRLEFKKFWTLYLHLRSEICSIFPLR
jgi:hypothetical protein